MSEFTTKMNEKDRQLAQNRDAYYRLRHQGLRPPQLDLASELEKKASDQFEIDTGHLVANASVSDRKRLQEAYQQIQLNELLGTQEMPVPRAS